MKYDFLIILECLFIIGLLIFLYLVLSDYFESKEKRETPAITHIKLVSGIIFCFLVLFIISLVETINKMGEKEEVAIYNEFDYNINDIVDKFLKYDNKYCKIEFKTDESNIKYIKIENYINNQNTFLVSIYNFKLDKDYFDDQLRLYIQGQ